MNGTKTCAYWSCQRKVSGRNFLCREHWEDLQDDFIDRCPICGRYKDFDFELCLDCKNRRPVDTRFKARDNEPLPKRPKVEHSKAWEKADKAAERFFVYILKLDNGDFYAGQTRELRERISEHRDAKTASTAGRNPRLQYFEVLPTRESAALREVDLKALCKKNPRQIRRMIIGFHDLLREVNTD